MKTKRIFTLILFVSFMFLLVGCTTTNKPHTHTFGTEWVSSETHHWHSATCEHEKQVSDKAKHDWDDAVVESNASCTEDGKQTLTCTVCGYVKEEKIDALGHSGEALYTWAEDNSSCTATFDCTVEGCDYVVTETVDSTSETVEDLTTYTVTFEAEVFESQYKEVESSGSVHTHEYGQLVSEVPATCTAAGTEAHYVCNCGKFFQLVDEEYVEVAEADLVIDALEHSHSSQWSYSDLEHWHECSCGDKADVEAHKGGTATTTAKAVCEVCNQPYGQLAEAEPNMVTVYFQNNWGWTDINIYVYLDNQIYLEAWPGKAMELVGSYDNQDLYAYTFDANKYVGFVVNGINNSWETPGQDQTPDILVSDSLSYLATDCFYMLWDSENSKNTTGHCLMSADKLHIHDYSNWEKDANKHWHECSCGLKQAEAAHEFGDAVVTEATCTAKGSEVYTCSVCQYEKSEEIAMLAHDYQEVAIVAATCEVAGKEAHYKCNECNKLFQLVDEEYVEVAEADLLIPAGHSWVAATCEAPKTCSVCETTEGDALGHAYGAVKYEWATDYSSCTATRVCANDSSHTETETVEAVYSHEDASEEANGYDKYVATFTNSAFAEQVHEVIIPAISHVHSYGQLVAEVAADCENAGKEAHYVCEGCHKLFQLVDEEYVEVAEADLVIEAKGHDYGQLVAEVAADCENAGKEAYYECSECHKLFQLVEEAYVEVAEADLVIEALGHSYKLEADDNNHWQECSVCHDTKDVEAHNGGTATETEKATCEACGTKYGELLLPEENMVTVYFQNNWWWTNINIYVYVDNKTYLSAWPGNAMELVGTYDVDQWKDGKPAYELYAFTFDANKYTGFIINGTNNGSTDQTPDILLADSLSYLASDCFYMLWDSENNKNSIGHCLMSEDKLHLHEVSSNWSKDAKNHWHTCTTCSAKLDLAAHSCADTTSGNKTCEVCGGTYTVAETKMVKVYLQNQWNWTNLHIYLWNEEGWLTAWPGDAMVKEGTIYDSDLYTFEFDANKYTHFKINGYDPGSGRDNETCNLVVADLLNVIANNCFYFVWNGESNQVELGSFPRP